MCDIDIHTCTCSLLVSSHCNIWCKAVSEMDRMPGYKRFIPMGIVLEILKAASARALYFWCSVLKSGSL